MIAERIKLLRESKGISQNQLAAMLHLSRSSVSAWEKGLNVPSTQVLPDLSQILEVSIDCLLNIEDAAMISVKGLDDSEISLLVSIADKFRENKTSTNK